MPGIDAPTGPQAEPEPLTRLPFPPISRSHILHCSYDYWHPKYRTSTLKSRIIPLSPAFLSYLREDGIILPPSTPTFHPSSSSPDYTDHSTSTGWDDSPDSDPSLQFPEIHQKIKDTIAELGGLVAPKLNWSAPKDATWISITKNSMECATPNDIYLLLKSSDFITHDLEHAFDSCSPEPSNSSTAETPYILVLRKWFKVNPSCEFRCFVRNRTLIGITQRDLNHFAFLFPMLPQLRSTIQTYFTQTLQRTFPDENFVFDIYLPEPYDKVRLMDINAWAPHTDPLLFSWLDLLTLRLPTPLLGTASSIPEPPLQQMSSGDESTEEDEVEDVPYVPEMRLVKKDDPEAYSFASPQYSAHKLPREVVEAGMSGDSGMREFADQWKRMMSGDVELQREGEETSDEEEERETADKNEEVVKPMANLTVPS